MDDSEMTDHETGIPHNPDTEHRGDLPFPVVGLGASAGGLMALKTFLENMPAKSGMSFVVILHLSPKHESVADKVLQVSTRMPVTQVTTPTPLERNHVYVISPNNDLSMSDGHLRVTEAERPRGHHVAIDLFFRTLADTHQDKAVGIVLSGTGADGAVGIARIKEQGAALPSRRHPRMPNTRTCRAARSPASRSTSCCRSPRSRTSWWNGGKTRARSSCPSRG